MKYTLPSLIVIVSVLAGHQPLQADVCPHLFSANAQSSSSYIQYCVSDNGNITSIVTPFNVQQIGYSSEGYGLCQESPVAEYHDYASDTTANWNAAELISLSNSSIKIKRTTSDGNFSLVQTISKVAATGAVKILMGVTNHQAVAKVVYLLRYASVKTNPYAISSQGASLNSAWSWDNSPNTLHHGLQLLHAAAAPFSYRQGFIKLLFGPNACDFAAGTFPTGQSGPDSGYPASILYVYAGSIPAGATRTVTLNYRGM